MTWFTTHLALEGLIGFLIIGSSLRNQFLATNRTKLLFFMANCMAIAPDFDIYFKIGIHRGFTHSLIFSLVFIGLGFFTLAYIKKFSSKNEHNQSLLPLLPYFFFLSAFFWGFHLMLDMDAAEGGMMLLWPLDDRLYQVSVFLLLDAFPFLFLPWTPLGIKLQVDQSTIGGLLSYLLNWTPQDFQNYYGTTNFSLALDGVILHISILILYLNYVVRPLIPKSNKKGHRKSRSRSITRFSLKLQNSWKQAKKEYLGPGILLFIIGFSIGPMITEKVYDSRDFSSTIEFNPHIFRPFVQINFETVNQPFDPGAVQNINYTSHIFTQQVNYTIVAVFTKQNWFNDFGASINAIANKFMSNNTPTNDSRFKQEYQSFLNEKISRGGLLYSLKLNGSQEENSNSFKLNFADTYSIGFILEEWFSFDSWNETNIFFSIHISMEQSYERYVNYFLGVVIEIIGIVLVITSFVPISLILRELKKLRALYINK